MPQPAANSALADELIALYREAEQSLVAQLEAAVNGSRAERRLRDLSAAVADTRAHLESATHEWLQTRLPVLHAAGGSAAADAVGSSFSWTQGHLEAVQALASQSWDTLAAGLRDMDDSARGALRTLARESAREALVEGRTAVQSAADFASAAREAGFATVTYSNGAVHSISDYATSAIRTITANSYNSGSLTQSRDDGIGYMEVFDGDSCGWSEHDDPDLANGTVRSVDDCDENPISHPNCERAFGPRPDISSDEEAAAANADG